MNASEVASAVDSCPGGWTLTNVVTHRDGAPRRYVAQRTFEARDEKTGEVSTTRQFESRVDPQDLLGDIHRRNLALGIERGGSPRRDV